MLRGSATDKEGAATGQKAMVGSMTAELWRLGAAVCGRTNVARVALSLH